MLSIHCGLRRTGTTSLQAVLARNQADLVSAGIVYPDRWRHGRSDAHHGLRELLERSTRPDETVRDFQAYLRANSTRTVLLSSESLATWLSDARRPALMRFLQAARDVTPVTCIWTLRSVDEILTSLYLHNVLFGYQLPEPGQYFREGAGRVREAVNGLRELATALDPTFAYVK